MEKKISLCIEPMDFFRELVSQAKSEQKLETAQATEFYIVNLLTHFMVADNLERNTLAEMLLGAANNPNPLERIKTLKKLGDTSLYVCGFFGDSLSRKLVDMDYYKDMGETAYGHLSISVKEDDFQAVYNELSQKFSGVVDVLTFISQSAFMQSNRNILRLYERYIRTGSELAKKQLAQMGIALTPGSVDKTFKN